MGQGQCQKIKNYKDLKSEFITSINGLKVQHFSTGAKDAPLILLLHGFPELAYSWRHLMESLASLGYRVIAPDKRGYGKTTGHSSGYNTDLKEFGMRSLARDVALLIQRLGYQKVELVIGHDFGSSVAAWSALIYPEFFEQFMLMSPTICRTAKLR